MATSGNIITGKPSQTYGGGNKRTCAADDCSVTLSIYNAKARCASCWDAVPLTERPYFYNDAWHNVPN